MHSGVSAWSQVCRLAGLVGDIIHRLYQKLSVQRFNFQELIPGKFMLLHLLPPGPFPLLRIVSHFAVAFLLHFCADFNPGPNGASPFCRSGRSMALGKLPRPAPPTATVHTKVLCLSRTYALVMALCTCHFRPVLTGIDCWCCNDICGIPVHHDWGSPNCCLRNWLMFFSNTSIILINSYLIAMSWW